LFDPLDAVKQAYANFSILFSFLSLVYPTSPPLPLSSCLDSSNMADQWMQMLGDMPPGADVFDFIGDMLTDQMFPQFAKVRRKKQLYTSPFTSRHSRDYTCLLIFCLIYDIDTGLLDHHLRLHRCVFFDLPRHIARILHQNTQ
jgi:hypothetical protein